MRAATAGSSARSRARSRFPAAARGRGDSRGGVAPSFSSTSAISGSGSAWKSTRTQREAMVTRSTGTSSARIRNDGRGRRLLDGLQEAGSSIGSQEVEVVQDQHLAGSLDGRQGGQVDDLLDLSLVDGGTHPMGLADVRVLPRSRQSGISSRRVRRRIEEERGVRRGPPPAWCILLGRRRGRREPGQPQRRRAAPPRSAVRPQRPDRLAHGPRRSRTRPGWPRPPPPWCGDRPPRPSGRAPRRRASRKPSATRW